MITLEANYSKKLGLPGYSSHQYSLTVRKEVADITQVEAESRQLYATLQTNVDRDIQQTGFLPLPNGNGNGHTARTTNGNGHHEAEGWKCSPKQKELILKIIDENHVDKNEVEALAKDRFNTPVKLLNKLQASGLIQELLQKYPGNESENGRRPANRLNGRVTR